MVKATLFVEGAAKGQRDCKYLQVRCRESFHKLIGKCGVPRNPAIKVCGGRDQAYKNFTTAHLNAAAGDYVAMLVDSEDPMADIEQAWAHLKIRDNWNKPSNATDEQVLLMSTCMETWIASDRPVLRQHYGANLQESALPSLHDMESRNRHTIQDALVQATQNCKNAYQKGLRSFEILEMLNPVELRKHLPSFVRCERLLREKL